MDYNYDYAYNDSYYGDDNDTHYIIPVYDPDGNLIYRNHFIDDYLDMQECYNDNRLFERKFFDEDGILKSQKYYEDSYSKIITYDGDMIYSILNFKYTGNEELLHGEYITYTGDGDIDHHQVYDNGRIIHQFYNCGEIIISNENDTTDDQSRDDFTSETNETIESWPEY
jgi:hypothetical protein